MNPRLLDLGDGALTLEFGERIDPALNARVMAARDALAGTEAGGHRRRGADLLFADGAFRSAAARQENPCRAPAGSRAGSCSKVGAGDTVAHTRVPFGGEFGPDLAEVTQATGRSEPDVIAAICAASSCASS
jgi:inhibitor of KinA